MHKLIGISGVARSGKDLFASVAQSILKEHGLSCEKYALAYELKNDLKELILSKTGINTFTENTEEKSIIRPLLVAYGDVMRKISNGTYWTQKLEKRIATSKSNIIFITDIRYNVYPNDECSWVKYKQGGILMHLSKYKLEKSTTKGRMSTAKPIKIYTNPANDHEMLNDPIVKSNADYVFEWEDCLEKLPGISTNEHPYIKSTVKEFLKKMNILS